MIEKIISEVNLAEERAKDIVNKAIAKSKAMVVNAEDEAEKMKKDTAQYIKDAMREAVAQAQAKADAFREEILQKGAQEAQRLVDERNKKIDEAADFLLQKLLEKYKV